nr:ABC transporter permease [Castellaniella sp.]
MSRLLRQSSPWQLWLGRLFARRVVALSAGVLLLIIILAASISWLSSADPNAIAIMSRLQAPSWQFWGGTDQLGRDVMLRVAYGGRYSLMIGFVTAIGAVVIGTLLGMLSGYFRRIDPAIMCVIDAMMAFPDILLGIALVSILGPSLWNVVLALIIVYTPRVARVARASTLVLRDLLYVDAARALGTPTWKILWMHIRGLFGNYFICMDWEGGGGGGGGRKKVVGGEKKKKKKKNAAPAGDGLVHLVHDRAWPGPKCGGCLVYRARRSYAGAGGGIRLGKIRHQPQSDGPA